MKSTGFLSMAVVLVALTGCASTSSSRFVDSRNVVDNGKIALVDQIALRRGVQTTWINPPTKRVALSEVRSD